MISVNRKAVAGWLPTLKRARPRVGLPILRSVRLEETREGLALAVTDLEVFALLEVEAERSGEPWAARAVCVDLETFCKAVKGSKAERLTLAVTADDVGALTLAADLFRLPGVSADEWPQLPDPPDAERTGDGLAFREGVAAVLHASSTDQSRYNLNGVYCEPAEHGGTRFTATDGHRLATATRSGLYYPLGFRDDGEPAAGAIEPRAFCELIARLPEKLARGAVILGGDRRLGRVTWPRGDVGTLTVTSRRIEGEFPNWRQVVPKAPKGSWVVDRAELTAALEAASAIASASRSRAVKLEGNGGTVVTVYAENPDAGEFRWAVPLERENGPVPEALAFNLPYLRAAIDATEGGSVVLGVSDALSPAVVNGSADGGVDYAVVMPMRL